MIDAQPHPDLFLAWPNHPGTKVTTSAPIAQTPPPCVEIRGRVYDALKQGDFTTTQIAQRIGLPFESVQPRTSELKDKGLIVDTGRRGPSRSPERSARVWARAAAPGAST